MNHILNNPILKNFDLTIEIFTEDSKRKWRFTCYRYGDPDGTTADSYQIIEEKYSTFIDKVEKYIKTLK